MGFLSEADFLQNKLTKQFTTQAVTKEMGSRTQMQRNGSFNNNIKQRRTKTTPKGKNKQAGRRLEHSQTQNSHVTYDTRKTTDQHRTTDTRRTI